MHNYHNDTKFNKYTIKEPIWKTKSVGIADYRLKHDLLVNISYKNKDGDILFPGNFLVKQEVAKTYPIQIIKGKVKLYIIPIDDLMEWKI
jgi:hypothetical protein